MNKLKIWKGRAFAISAILLLSLAGTFAIPNTTSAAGCRSTEVGMNNGYNTNQWATFSGGVVDYWYTDWTKSPSWATSCKDVNINYVSVPGDTYGGQCVQFRAVRNYDWKASNWTVICPDSGWRVIFSGMYGNTYRVEAKPITNSNYRPYYTIKD